VVYETENGILLKVGRINRMILDTFAAGHPEPEPPMMTVTAWGDEEEEIPVHDDPAYMAARLAWFVQFGEELFNLIASAIELPDDIAVEAELDELRDLGLGDLDDKSAFLRYAAVGSVEELRGVVDLVLYNSTVTVRGLEEAAKVYGVTWMDREVPVFAKVEGDAKASGIFGDRQAAQWAHYRWGEFCEMTGPEQSMVVALHRLTLRLEELMMRQGT
jgi:hypothetical protein